MYDTLINFIGTPPEGLEPILYIACIAFTMHLSFEFFQFLRIFVMRVVSKYERS